jgi:hypothetical protein
VEKMAGMNLSQFLSRCIVFLDSAVGENSWIAAIFKAAAQRCAALTVI